MLLVVRDGMAVAAAIGGDILYLMPSRPDLEARTTEICVQVRDYKLATYSQTFQIQI